MTINKELLEAIKEVKYGKENLNENKKSIDIYTNYYERSHGKKPKGRGGWMFDIVDTSGKENTVETVSVPGSMTLADAKVWIKAYVRKKYAKELKTGYLDIQVAP